MAVNVIRPQSIPLGEVDLTWMLGRTLAALSFSEPYHWVFTLTDGGVISTDGLWRVVAGKRLVVTSEDHGHRFGLGHPVDAAERARELLSSKVLEAVVDPVTSDLLVKLEGTVELQLVTTWRGYEAWQVEAPDGRCFVVDGSGNASTWFA